MPPTSLSFLSWNLAMLEPSDQAPLGWGMEHTEDAVRQRVMALDPDIVVFQELPRLVPYIPSHAMVKANPETHSGNLAVLIRHGLLSGEPSFVVVNGCALVVQLSADVSIANVHLMAGPGRDPAAMRADQLQRVVEAAPTAGVLVVGDTNTRADEEPAIRAHGLIGERPSRPTWDTIKNPFRQGGREFRAHFTRWFATDGVEVGDVEVHDEPWEHDATRFHLSDHFALTGRVSLAT